MLITGKHLALIHSVKIICPRDTVALHGMDHSKREEIGGVKIFAQARYKTMRRGMQTDSTTNMALLKRQ